MDLQEKITAEEIMNQYDDEHKNFEKVLEIASKILNSKLKDSNIFMVGITSRIKQKTSLQGKLFRKSGKYSSLYDITDILGMRLISYYSDDIAKIADIVESSFIVDYDNSVNKADELDVKSFGYVSVHYIVSLKIEDSNDEHLSSLRFEIQLRSGLQHIWADINHDMEYKNTFGVPKNIVRRFSRIAGLLEIADDEFISLRKEMNDYVMNTRQNLSDGKIENIVINDITLDEYMNHSKKMNSFLETLSHKACLKNSEIAKISPSPYVSQLNFLGITLLEQIDLLIDRAGGTAIEMAMETLRLLDIDILSSNVGLRFLCRAELALGDYTKDQITDFFMYSYEKRDKALKQADSIIEWRNRNL